MMSIDTLRHAAGVAIVEKLEGRSKVNFGDEKIASGVTAGAKTLRDSLEISRQLNMLDSS